MSAITTGKHALQLNKDNVQSKSYFDTDSEVAEDTALSAIDGIYSSTSSGVSCEIMDSSSNDIRRLTCTWPTGKSRACPPTTAAMPKAMRPVVKIEDGVGGGHAEEGRQEEEDAGGERQRRRVNDAGDAVSAEAGLMLRANAVLQAQAIEGMEPFNRLRLCWGRSCSGRECD
jgi:hypothetical protein